MLCLPKSKERTGRVGLQDSFQHSVANSAKAECCLLVSVYDSGDFVVAFKQNKNLELRGDKYLILARGPLEHTEYKNSLDNVDLVLKTK